jgi:hypothetical protein
MAPAVWKTIPPSPHANPKCSLTKSPMNKAHPRGGKNHQPIDKPHRRSCGKFCGLPEPSQKLSARGIVFVQSSATGSPELGMIIGPNSDNRELF